MQTLAIKWLHARWSSSTEYTSRLRDEARLLALLRHPAIVGVHGLTRIDGRLAILMEPIDGVDLSHVDRLPLRAALQVAAETADALDAAWSQQPSGHSAPLHVVHRDIKPSNIMVTARGAVKVMDFGVARASFDTREAQTRSQQFGTARYMAPERWLNGVAEAPSDIFSLGVTLMELASGEAFAQPRLSREGFAADLDAGLKTLPKQVELEALIRRMCAFLPQDRPDASEVSRLCQELSNRVSGQNLRTWAAVGVVIDTSVQASSPLTGTEVHEDSGDIDTTFAPEDLDGTTDRPAPPHSTKTKTRPIFSLGNSDIVETQSHVIEDRRRGRAPWFGLGLMAVGLSVGWWMWPPSVAFPADPTPLPQTELAAVAPVLVEPEVVKPDAAPVPQPEVAVHSPAPASPPKRFPQIEDDGVVDVQTEPEAEKVHVIFNIDKGLLVRTPYGDAKPPRQGLKLPKNQTVRLTVTEDGEQWTCQISVGSTTSQISIQGRDNGRCHK